MQTKLLKNEILNIFNSCQHLEGLLSDEEIKFLALAALYPTTKGTILEIGSFKGKSTCILAKALAAIQSDEKVNAVDPLTSPCKTDPDLHGQSSCLNDFRNNLQNAGIENYVDFHQLFSSDLAKTWNKKIRFLWIDGDHTYNGAKQDFDMFLPYLEDGAIVALHDTLKHFDGPIRVFTEDILLSRNFGAVGLCKSISWGQYLKNPTQAEKYRNAKIALYHKISKLVPYQVLYDSEQDYSSSDKLNFKIARALTPHEKINIEEWVQKVIKKN